MVTRLSASDASFYHLENTSTPMYVGSLSILRKPRNRAELRSPAGHRRTAAAADPALPPEGPRSDPRPGPAGVGRRPRLRHHLPHPALGAAVAGQRRPAARTDRPAGLPAAGQVAAAVGDVPDRGAGQEPHRDLHEVPSGAGERDDRAGDRPRHRRPHPEGPRSSARTSGFPAREPSDRQLAARRGGRVGHPAGRAAGAVRSTRSPRWRPTRGSWSRWAAGSSTSPAPSPAAPRRTVR